jgi:hypothetical protein
LHNRDFIVNAYRTLLHREPDPGGLQHYLGMLLQGESKLEIIRRIRYSDEGRAIGTDVGEIRTKLAIAWIYRIPAAGQWIRAIATSLVFVASWRKHLASQRQIIEELIQLRSRNDRLVRIEHLARATPAQTTRPALARTPTPAPTSASINSTLTSPKADGWSAKERSAFSTLSPRGRKSFLNIKAQLN